MSVPLVGLGKELRLRIIGHIPPARPGRVRLGKRRKSMKRLGKSMWLAVLLAGALVSILSPNAAAQNGSIAGTILDVNGKPWFGLNVEAVSEQGAKYDAKTDAQGEYAIRNLRAGVYKVTITTFPP